MFGGAGAKLWVSGGAAGKLWKSGGAEGKQWVSGGARGKLWMSGGTQNLILSRPFLVPFLVPAFLLSQVPGGFYTLFYTHLLCHKNGRRMPHY